MLVNKDLEFQRFADRVIAAALLAAIVTVVSCGARSVFVLS